MATTRDLLAGEGAGRRARVLNHGWVELVDMMPRLVAPGRLGAESAATDAARASYARDAPRARAPGADRALFRYLLAHRHTTPLEKIVFTFRARAPLFVARQWMRHRAGSFNELSARYARVADEGYVPAAAEVRAQAGGAAASHQAGGEPLDAAAAAAARTRIRGAWERAYADYLALLEAGVAREVARTVLPVGMYTTFVWKVDLWNLFHFLDLRLAPDAQEQIRVYAEEILALVTAVAPHAAAAFHDYVRGAVTLSAPEVRAIAGGGRAGMTAREGAALDAKLAALGLAPPSAGEDGESAE